MLILRAIGTTNFSKTTVPKTQDALEDADPIWKEELRWMRVATQEAVSTAKKIDELKQKISGTSNTAVSPGVPQPTVIHNHYYHYFKKNRP